MNEILGIDSGTPELTGEDAEAFLKKIELGLLTPAKLTPTPKLPIAIEILKRMREQKFGPCPVCSDYIKPCRCQRKE